MNATASLGLPPSSSASALMNPFGLPPGMMELGAAAMAAQAAATGMFPFMMPGPGAGISAASNAAAAAAAAAAMGLPYLPSGVPGMCVCKL